MESIEEAKRILKTADHMLYITYPVIKENRLLIKILEEIHYAMQKIIESILKREYTMKRIRLYTDVKANMETFEQKCAERYGLSEQLEGIRQISYLYNAHKSSPVEFSRSNKYVILADNLHTENITLPKMKGLLSVAKETLRKTEMTLSYENAL